ncbi:MAG: DMT family transporter [Cyanobacteria bacterium P01_F01_bin.150]
MRLLGTFLIVISAIAFGAMPIFAHFAYGASVTPLTALFFRFAIAALCLCSTLIIHRVPLPNPRNFKILILLGGVGFVVQSITFFTALTFVSPGLVVLLLYLYPTIVVGLSIFCLNQPSSPTKLMALAIALLGTVLTIGPVEKAQLLGVALGLISAVTYAVYVLVGDRVMQEESPLTTCTVMISAAALVFGSMVAIQGVSLPTSVVGWMAIAALGLISTVIAIGALFAGIKCLGATTASMLSTLEPVVTIVLAFWLLQQPITIMQIIGGALILMAVMLLSLEKQLPKLSTAGFGGDSDA